MATVERTEPAWPPAVRAALWITVIGIVLYVALDLVAQLLPPHYNPISQAESDLGVGPYGWVMNLNFVVRGILSLAFVYGLYRAWPNSDPPRLGLALIAAWAVGAFVLAANPADISGPATLHGQIHLITAFVAFLLMSVGALLVAYAMPAMAPWDRVRAWAQPLSILAFVAMLVLLFTNGIPRIEQHYFGLIERIFLGFALAFLFVVAWGLLRWGPPRPVAPRPTGAE